MTLFSVWFSGCATTKTDGRKEYLLGNTVFKGNKVIKNEDMEALIPTKPNRRFLALPLYPYLWLYRVGESVYNKEHYRRRFSDLTLEYQIKAADTSLTTKAQNKLRKKYARRIEKARLGVDEGNWWMRVPGEPPVFHSKADVEKNLEKIRSYLFNRGFFEATVSAKSDTSFQRVRNTYHITEGRPTIIRDVTVRSRNKDIDSLLHHGRGANSKLRQGDRYDQAVFEEERIRIESLLKNNGFFAFGRQNISFLINDTIRLDTDSLRKTIDIRTYVANTPPAGGQKRFRIDSLVVDIQPSNGLPAALNIADTVTYQGIMYIHRDKRYSPRILNSMIRLRPDSVFSQLDERYTQRQLSLTDQFQFVNVMFDSTGNKLNGRINMIPLNKYELSTDLGLNVIQSQAPGPFATFSYKIRNVFNGLENFEVNLRGGIEAVSGYGGRNLLYRSTELGLNSSLTFPQLLVPVGGIRYKYGHLNPKTQVNLGYNYVDRPEYVRTSIKSAATYSLQPNNHVFYNLSLIDLSVLNTQRINSEFQQLLDSLAIQGNNLRNSFLRSFVSDINFTFVYNTNPLFGAPENARYLRASVESGGTTLNFLPGQMNIINKIVNPGAGRDTLQFFKYIRWNFDFRKYWRISNTSSFVARINAGGVHSYGGGRRGISSVPPYEKYFFAGGSNSVRAWLPRRLGPGSTKPRYTSNNLSIESPGEFLLEGNLELRGHLANFFGKINYALFLDAGNVWNMSGSELGPGTLRANRFFKEIAVGTGFGLRYDFSFVVLRFDFGAKVYDPFLQRFVLDELKFNKLFNNRQTNFLNLNIGVGYPF
ncbi:BamA/TamA family outer membrane protein [Ravibacter arvi]